MNKNYSVMQFIALVRRNSKLFFKDKGLFFTSLITPAILLVLYITFLGNVYRDAFYSSLPEGFDLPKKLINGLVGGELASSLLAVSPVTVGFCSNMLMVQDKVTKVRQDLTISPVKGSVLALSYYMGTFISTMLVSLAAVFLCFVYMLRVGWYLSAADVSLILFDVFIMVLFGTGLSSIINTFLSTQGQMSAVGTIISAGYGFICGAYMPISNFSDGLQKVISFLPGTYGTSLIRNHALQGCFEEMKAQKVPAELIEKIKDSVDCNLYFFGDKLKISTMYMVVIISVIVLIFAYVIVSIFKKEKK